MRAREAVLGILLSWVGLESGVAAPEEVSRVTIDPPEVLLDGPVARRLLLVDGHTADGTVVDLTGEARFVALQPEIASIDDDGVIRPVADGSAQVRVEVAGQTRLISVHVVDSKAIHHFSFVGDVMPLLDKFGCNGAGCHGKAEGQGGFKLSVFNSDPKLDYEEITLHARGRRVSPALARESLILLKASGRIPHGGGARIVEGSEEYVTLHDWLAAGIPYGTRDQAEVVGLEVTPRERIIPLKGRQQLRVVALYSDGRTRDVTPIAQYASNHPGLVSVTEGGLTLMQDRPGLAAVRASFMNHHTVFRVMIPRPESVDYPEVEPYNFIDELVYPRLRGLNIIPSELCTDAEFLRRAFLDVIGTLPTVEETRRFLTDERLDRRARLIDELLARPEYADYWGLKWSDVLRVDRAKLQHHGAYVYYRWIREAFAKNQPFDEFARDIVIAKGPLVDNPQGQFYKTVGDAGKMATELSRAFLGVEIACAQCHHHPTDVWSQNDYYGMQAFFAQVKTKGTLRGPVLAAEGQPETKHPRTGQPVFAYALGTEMPEASPQGDRREGFADWLTDPDNRWFAKNIANRIWAQFLGRGLVHPVDDVRASNPPSNPELLEALARHLVEVDFDLHEMIRTITSSRVYQLSSATNETNIADDQNYSHAFLRTLEAEVLLDAVCQVTGVPEKFDGVPAGRRAIELWDSGVEHYFLKLFGRPLRASACVCERIEDANVAQALHLMNSPNINAKLKHGAGRVVELVGNYSDPEKLTDELYLNFFSRYPSADERQTAVRYLREAADRQRAAEDLAWTMLCSTEFIFRH